MERLILFSSPMVRAILDGRKTQTRRIVKSRDVTLSSWTKPFEGPHFGTDSPEEFCPYGKPGDRLWVRETWCWGTNTEFQCKFPHKVFPDNQSSIALYRADAATLDWINESDAHHNSKRKWKPSIHMPRWASRLTLEITEVRVQRLQDINESDAKDEGAGILADTGEYEHWDGDPNEYRKLYRALWESINGKGSWNINPWVWVITFRVQQSNESTTQTDALAIPDSSSAAQSTAAEGEQEGGSE